MSMELCLKRASEIDLARYAREGFAPDDAAQGAAVPAFADLRRKLAVSAPNVADPRAVDAWLENAGKLAKELVAQGASLRPSTAAPPSRQRTPTLNLHKSWHVLHYLFTGKAWDGPLPAATLLLGGREIGKDLGYGRARALAPAPTSAFAQFLSGLTVADLTRRLDLRAMQKLDIYCAEDDDESSRLELAEDVEHIFPQLQAYVGEAARNNAGLVIWMS